MRGGLMEQLQDLEAARSTRERRTPFWKDPVLWLQEKELGRDFWVFFTAAFFFDLGFAVYFFLMNLYLLDLHYNERVIGLVGGALSLGSVVGTLPAGLLSRRIGIRSLLIVCFATAPALGALRVVASGETAEIALAFLAGLAMCLWGVCFLPAVARFTTERSRASAFSLIFSVSIGTSTLGGVVCGYLPQWLRSAGLPMQPAEVKRLILLTACGVAALGLFSVVRLRLPPPQSGISSEDHVRNDASVRRRRLDPFLLRFLPVMALWTAVLASFTPFANVYLSRDLQVPFSQIGLVFSAAQIIQFCAGLLTPLLFRALGLVDGIVATQLLAAVAIGCLAGTRNRHVAVALYLVFSAMQWMSSPGLYNLLMSRVPDERRSTAASMTLFCNAILQSAATAGAGVLLVRFGYPHVLGGIAVLAMVVAILFRTLVASTERRTPA
jgi:MFS family permease